MIPAGITEETVILFTNGQIFGFEQALDPVQESYQLSVGILLLEIQQTIGDIVTPRGLAGTIAEPDSEFLRTVFGGILDGAGDNFSQTGLRFAQKRQMFLHLVRHGLGFHAHLDLKVIFMGNGTQFHFFGLEVFGDIAQITLKLVAIGTA